MELENLLKEFEKKRFKLKGKRYFLFYNFVQEKSRQRYHKIYISEHESPTSTEKECYMAQFIDLKKFVQAEILSAYALKGHKLTTYIFKYIIKRTGKRLRSSRINSNNCKSAFKGNDYLIEDGIELWENYFKKGNARKYRCRYYWKA